MVWVGQRARRSGIVRLTGYGEKGLLASAGGEAMTVSIELYANKVHE